MARPSRTASGASLSRLRASPWEVVVEVEAPAHSHWRQRPHLVIATAARSRTDSCSRLLDSFKSARGRGGRGR
jgi:hypothetical protein